MMAPSESLVVLARAIEGTSLVTYTILPKEDGTPLKVSRFSQLDALHKQLIKQVPTFRGRLPAKTMTRHTSVEFVESRRKGIESYLRFAAGDNLVRSSIAWTSF